MISEDKVRELVETGIAGTPHFVVEVKVRPGNKIVILLDSDRGISIDDCARVSRLIEAGFDRDTEDFELEVSSSGLGEPFKIVRQYKKHLGKQVQTITKEGQKVTGKLLEATSEGIVIEEKPEGRKSKQTEIQQINLPFEKIKETKLIVSF